MCVAFLSMPSVFREANTKEHQVPWRAGSSGKGWHSQESEEGEFGKSDNRRFNWQDSLKQERIGDNKNQREGSKETNNFEYFHFFTYNSTRLKLFQKPFQKDGEIHQPAPQCL